MGVINAALYSVGSTVWLAGSAVFVVLAVDVLRMAVMNGYDRALADAPLREQRVPLGLQLGHLRLHPMQLVPQRSLGLSQEVVPLLGLPQLDSGVA